MNHAIPCRAARSIAAGQDAKAAKATAPVLLLVPQAKRPERPELTRDADRGSGSLPGRIVTNRAAVRQPGRSEVSPGASSARQ